MMTASLPHTLPHSLERSILIHARRDVVFAFFTDSARWASWWGQGSTIDAHPGGRVYIRHPNGIEASGEVLEIAPPDRLVFSYGFASGTPMPPGSSRVTITLAAVPGATRLNLTHELADAIARDEHVQGWRYQLSVFANAVADEVNAGAAAAADAWFATWTIADAAERERALAAVADPHVTFRDRYSCVDGIADLVPHLGAVQRFMPGMRLQRTGGVRHCQGTALADWVAIGPDGQERGSGTNVFVFDETGRISAVTGLWR